MERFPSQFRIKEVIYSDEVKEYVTEERFVVDGRRSKDDSYIQYYAKSPYTGGEIGVYDSIESGSQFHDTGKFYVLEKIIEE